MKKIESIVKLLSRIPKIPVCAMLVIAASVFLAKRTYQYNVEGSAMMQQSFEMKTLMSSKHIWNARENWISERIPRFDTQNGASMYLLESLRRSLVKHGLELDSHKLYPREAPTEISLDPIQSFDKATIDIAIKGSEQAIVKWIHEVQTPGKFTGIENLAVQLDHYGLVCELQVSQWYLDNNRSFNPG